MADHVLSQTSNTNKKKIKKLGEHVTQLCTDVLAPLYGAADDMELPSALVDDIETFSKYAEFYYFSSVFLTCRSSELRALTVDLEDRSAQGWPRRVLGADGHRDELTILSEGIKNVVDRLMVSRHCTRYSNLTLMTHT